MTAVPAPTRIDVICAKEEMWDVREFLSGDVELLESEVAVWVDEGPDTNEMESTHPLQKIVLVSELCRGLDITYQFVNATELAGVNCEFFSGTEELEDCISRNLRGNLN